MALRFRDTTIWSEDWYFDLGAEYALFWTYITDNCDNAGVWKPNKGFFERAMNCKINLTVFLTKINQDKVRIICLENGRWFLPNFIKFQWFSGSATFKFSDKNKLHVSLKKILNTNNISELSVRGLEDLSQTSGRPPSKSKGKRILVETIPLEKSTENFIIPEHSLQVFVREKFPHVSKMELQLTAESSARVMQSFPDKEKIKKILEAMENYKPLLKNNRSVEKTLLNWLSREYPSNTNSSKQVNNSGLA